MATQDSTAVPTEAVSMDEIKKLYPDEWVLLANPVRAENGVDIVSGIPLDHSWDKRELAYRWRGNLTGYKTYTLKFVRPDGPVRKYNRFIPFITRRTRLFRQLQLTILRNNIHNF